ncbi:MAG: InlB B-repeat-containing protein [Synergistaceae bacterium]|nr:InlB B-repeat-containing protein [Synergistaceae bacterium]
MRKLTVLLVLLVCCFAVFAAFAAYADQGGEVGNGVRWDFKESTGVLTFSYTGSGSGEMPNYTNGYNPWRDVKDKVTLLEIGDGITHIGNHAFDTNRRSKGWKRASIADTVKTIGDYAFNSCYDIGVLKMGKNVEKIGAYAFVNPSALTILTLPSTLKEIGENAFMQAFSLGVLTFTVPKAEDYHDLDIGKNAFEQRRGKIKIAYTSEKGILRDRNTVFEIAEGVELSEGELSSRQLTWVKHTPTNYVVTYDPNGGRMTGGITTMRVPVNTTAKLHTLEKLGLYNLDSNLKFRGWSTDPKAKKAQYKDGAELLVTDDMTLYAVWRSEYTITLDANGGKFVSGDKESAEFDVDVKIDSSVTLPTAAALGLKSAADDLLFAGWALASADTKAAYADGAELKPSDDMTLYAVWKNACTLIFDANGGTFTAKSEDLRMKVTAGTNIILTPSQTLGLKHANKDLYYNGWALTPSGDVKYSDNELVTVSDDMTLYAVWTEDGDGSEGSPYLIDSFDRLKELASKVNGGEHYSNKHFKLTAEIWDKENNFTPIGKNYNLSFNGIFNGGGHTIKYKIADSSETYQGLFGCLDGGAEIRNLAVEAEISNCDMYTGGIAGETRISCIITNCASSVTITAKDSLYEGYVGGIVGLNTGLMNYCFAEANINSKVDKVRVGGIAGVNQTGTLAHCAATAQVKRNTKTKYIGAVTGDNKTDSSTPGTITDSYYCILPVDGADGTSYKGIGGRRGSTDNDGNKGVTTPLTLAELSNYGKNLSSEYAVCKRGIIKATSLGADDDESGNNLGGNYYNEDDYSEDDYNEDDEAVSSHGSSSGCGAFNFNALILVALCLVFMTRRFKL